MNREQFKKKQAELYDYKKQQAIDAADAYAAACQRCGARWDRITIVQFCANTFPDMRVSDALEIAQCIRGRWVE